MPERPDSLGRGDLHQRAQDDLDRHRRREPDGRFWHAAALMGSVGWPIVLLALGGAWLGRVIDARVGHGVRWTLMFVVLGAGLGTFMALRSVRGPR
ncbi:MAG: AtpZ/AtpI family protein [Nannocystaceae bacterium]